VTTRQASKLGWLEKEGSGRERGIVLPKTKSITLYSFILFLSDLLNEEQDKK
jgi:hypothetical protein